MDTPLPDHVDVLVVGAGPAGSSLAGLLARDGHEVLVVEREHFPRYHVGESLITGVRSVLEELDVADRVATADFAPKHGLCLVWGRNRDTWPIAFSETDGPDRSYHVDRGRFDQLLLERAAEWGAEVAEGVRVRGPVVVDGRVTGVVVDGPDGDVEVGADLVVDASGQARVIARRTDEPRMMDDLRHVATWTYYDRAERLPAPMGSYILVEKTDPGQGWCWAVPLAGGRTSVGHVQPVDDVSDGTPEERFRAALGRTRETARLVGDAEPVEPFRTGRDWSYLSTDVVGPGWASVGDAAGFIDPLLSTGICLGMLQAHALATAIDLGAARPAVAEEAMDRYQRGCLAFLESMTSYVRFFYDADRDREDYQALAQQMADPAGLGSARDAFVSVVTGTSSLADTFDFAGLGHDDGTTDDEATAMAAATSAGAATATQFAVLGG